MTKGGDGGEKQQKCEIRSHLSSWKRGASTKDEEESEQKRHGWARAEELSFGCAECEM